VPEDNSRSIAGSSLGLDSLLLSSVAYDGKVANYLWVETKNRLTHFRLNWRS
jgi:hypothetical protein